MIEYINKSYTEICSLLDTDTLTFYSDCFVLSFKDTSKSIRYRFDISTENYKNFQKQQNILFKQFLEIIKLNKNNPIYVFVYEKSWNVFDSDVFLTLDTMDGVLKTDEVDVVELIFEKALRYEIFPVFFNKSLNVAVIPTDHLDLFVLCNKCSLNDMNFDLNAFSLDKTQ